MSEDHDACDIEELPDISAVFVEDSADSHY